MHDARAATKRVADAKMAAFDALAPDVRQAYAEAVYGWPVHAGLPAQAVVARDRDVCEARDLIGVGPVPRMYTRKRRRRQR